MSLASRRVYQFGEFELKVSARLLSRSGKPVPLGSKAFEVLTCLVVNAGEVVTKDELLKTVWPESFVEEGNLSQHIFALRKALGDRSAYIVTIPGRGYQFTEPVRQVAETPPAPLADSSSFLLQRTRERTRIVIEETSPLPGGTPPREAPPPLAPWPSRLSPNHREDTGTVLSSVQSGVKIAVHEGVAADAIHPAVEPAPAILFPSPYAFRRRRAWLWAVAALSAIAIFAAWFAWHRPARIKPVDQKIVLAELDNRTGDPGLDDVLRKALEIDLDQSPYIDVMSESEALGTLQLMGVKPEAAFVPAIAREVCERSNRQVLITGSVASLGQKYLLTLEATDCNSGKILAAAKAVAASKEETLAALDSVSAKLRHGLGESAASLERFQVPIAQATTSSLEALRQYSTGEYLLGRLGKEEIEVLPFFQKAVELDPQFAMAQAAVATGYFSLGEYQLAVPYYQKAFDLSSHVSEKEGLYIRAHYYADAKRDVNQGIHAYQMWAEVYPRDWGPWLDLAVEYTKLGQYDAAIAADQHALALDPTRGIVYSVLARNYMHVGRYADAESTANQALAMGKDSALLDATLFETALLDHDAAIASRAVTGKEHSQNQWDLLDLQALAVAKDGKYKRSEELFRAAYNAAIRESLPEKADGILIDQASAEHALGMDDAARTTLHRVKLQQDNPEAPFLQAALGDISSAERALAPQGSPTNSDTLMAYVYRPRIRAEIALRQAKPLQAIAELEPAAEYEFAPGFGVIAERGEAYLQARRPEQAAAEFRKVLDHPGVDPVSPFYPLAWLGLARAESQAGRVAQSRAAYEKLFGLWSEADPDLPALLAARREYASLIAAPR